MRPQTSAARRRSATDCSNVGETEAICADFTREEDVDALSAEIARRHTRLDLLFNNAGIGARAVPMDELSVALWRAVVDTNLTGTFLCTRAAFHLMRNQTPQDGRIINNGSIPVTAPRPFSAPHTATKHAISELTKSTSLDGRAFNIACGQIDIGNAATEMVKPMQQGIVQATALSRWSPQWTSQMSATPSPIWPASARRECSVLYCHGDDNVA